MRRLLCVAAAVLLVSCALASAAGSSAGASPPLAKLLARYVPVLVLHPAERFGPVAVEGFLADSDLTERTQAGWVKVEGPPPAGGADLRLDQRLCNAVEGPAASPCYAAAQAAHGTGPEVVYGAAFRAKRRIDLQYWLWYPYNDYSPTVPSGELWQVHEGDWEAVSVVLDAAGKPLAAAYSQHDKGKRRDWAKVPKRARRPLVYVAIGSHANYFTAGTQRFDPRVVEPLFISIIRQAGFTPADHTGRGRVVRPSLVPVTTRSPGWMTFAGSWGESGYVRSPGGQPVALGAGPRGPAFHAQWRRPVTEALSWPRG